MGTISDKIDRIYDTKKDIARAIQEKGVRVYEEDTFRSYAEKIRSLNTDDYDENADYQDLNDPSYSDSSDPSSGGGDGDSTTVVKYKGVKKTITKNGKHYADGTYEPLTEEDKKKIDNQNKWDASSSPQFQKLNESAESKNKEIQDATEERDKMQQQADGMPEGQEKQKLLQKIDEKTGIITQLTESYNSIHDQMTSATSLAAGSGTITEDIDPDEEEFNRQIEQWTEERDAAETQEERDAKQKKIDDLTKQHRQEMGLDTTDTNAETQYYFSEVTIDVDEDSESEFVVSFWNDGEQLVMGKNQNGEDIKEITVPRGGSALYSGETPESDDPDKFFCGWNPKPVNVQSNLRCYAQFCGVTMGFTEQADHKEIKDTWAEIVANGGAKYDIGQWKILPIPNNLRFKINDQSGYLSSNLSTIMMKVGNGEGSDGSSTWLSLNPIGGPTGTQRPGDGSNGGSDRYGIWWPYDENTLYNFKNTYAATDGTYKQVKLLAPIPFNKHIYYSTNNEHPLFGSGTDPDTRLDGAGLAGLSGLEDYSWGGSECYVRDWLNGEFLSKLPEVIRNGIKPARKRTPLYIPKATMQYNTGASQELIPNGYNFYDEDGESRIIQTTDSIWLPSLYEIFGDSMFDYYGTYTHQKSMGQDFSKLKADGEITYDLLKAIKVGGTDHVTSKDYFSQALLGWNRPTTINRDPLNMSLADNIGPFPFSSCISRNTSVMGASVKDGDDYYINAELYAYTFNTYGEQIYFYAAHSNYGPAFYANSLKGGLACNILFGFCL